MEYRNYTDGTLRSRSRSPRSVIVLAVYIIAILIGIFTANYFLTRHTVTFESPKEVESIAIYNDNGSDDANASNKAIQNIKPVSSSQNITLKDGNYYVSAGGEKLADNKQKFTVDGNDIDIPLTPSYTETHLEELYVSQKSEIEAVMQKQYPTIGTTYVLQKPGLYGRGDWFGTIVAQNVDPTLDRPEYYRLLAHKENDTWVLQGYPRLVYLQSDFPKIPKNILDMINTLYQ